MNIKNFKSWFFGSKEETPRKNYVRKGLCVTGNGLVFLMVGEDKYGRPAISFESPTHQFTCSLTEQTCQNIESALFDARLVYKTAMEKKNDTSTAGTSAS